MEKSLDFTDIFMNQTQIMEIFNRQQARNSRFDKQLVGNHKAYGNRIFKRRHAEYFKDMKVERYETPFLRLRERHRYNRARLTKDQKR